MMTPLSTLTEYHITKMPAYIYIADGYMTLYTFLKHIEIGF